MVYGAEIQLNMAKKIVNHIVSASGNYAFTKSVNQENKKQLAYTPLHKASFQIQYQYKGFSVTPSYQFIGNVFTTASNEKSSQIDGYGLFDVNFRKHLNWNEKGVVLNFTIKNIANKAYMSMPERLMPGRNYHIQIIKKF